MTKKQEIERIIFEADSEAEFVYEPGNVGLAIVTTQVDTDVNESLCGMPTLIAKRYFRVHIIIDIYENGVKCYQKRHRSDFDDFAFSNEDELKKRVIQDLKDHWEMDVHASASTSKRHSGPWEYNVQIRDEAGVFSWLAQPKELAQYIFKIES